MRAFPYHLIKQRGKPTRQGYNMRLVVVLVCEERKKGNGMNEENEARFLRFLHTRHTTVLVLCY